MYHDGMPLAGKNEGGYKGNMKKIVTLEWNGE